jgi:hypothetical protein
MCALDSSQLARDSPAGCRKGGYGLPVSLKGGDCVDRLREYRLPSKTACLGVGRLGSQSWPSDNDKITERICQTCCRCVK